MKTAIAHLNWVLDDADMPAAMKEDAREALYKIEHCELAMAALRTLLDHPNNAEAKAHAEKVLASIAWRPKPKAAPTGTTPQGETPVPSSSSKTVAPVGAAPVLEDASDLV